MRSTMDGTGACANQTRIRTRNAADLACVEAVLEREIARHAAVMSGVDGTVSPLPDAVRDAAFGGKRLRASFCLWGSRAAADDGEPAEGAVEVAAAVELFHLAALIHDDIMDNSDVRRGRPAVHRRFAEDHRGSGSLGNAESHGSAVAILAGDLCLAWSDDLLADALAGLPVHIGRATRNIWSRMRDEAFAGQFLDMLSQTRTATPESMARTILRFKSAKYTIGHPLRLGGALSGASPMLLEQFDEIGMLAGEAFQLRDDLLGVFGEPADTGKPVLDDIREGKRTILVALTEASADASGRKLLSQCLGNPSLTEYDLDAVRDLMVTTGAVGRVEERIEVLAVQSLRLADALRVDLLARCALSDLIRRCVWRHA